MKNSFFILFLFLSITISAQQTTNVMTYNIRYDNKQDMANNWEKRKEKIVDLIHYHAPSIIGTQEGLFHQIQYLDKALTNYQYFGIGREKGENKGEFSAIFYDTTKYTLLESTTFWLSTTPEKVSVGWDAALERICTYGILKSKLDATKIWVFNTHFDHRGKEARAQSARLILKKINTLTAKEDAPVLLLGDFNMLPEDASIIEISKQLNDAQKNTKHKAYGPLGTFNGFDLDKKMERRIDYIFVKNVEILKYAHIDDRLDDNKFPSDHLPVWVKVALPAEGKK